MIRKKTIVGSVAVIASVALLAGCSSGEITVSIKRVELALGDTFSNAGFVAEAECPEQVVGKIGETFECLLYESVTDPNKNDPLFTEVRIEESGYSWRLIEEEGDGDWRTLRLPAN